MGYLLAALLSGFFLFNQAASPHKAADLAEKALRKQYPGAAVQVDIEGKRGTSVLRGQFRLVRVEMSHLALSQLPFAVEPNPKKVGRAQKIEVELRDLTMGNLPVSRVRLDFRDVQYDFDALKNRAQFQMARTGPAKLQLQLSASALLPSFAEKFKNTENVSVAIDGKMLTLRGTRSVLGSDTPIVVSGELKGRGAELRLENSTLSLGGVRLPSAASSVLLKDLNPLYDFDKSLKWPFRTEITAVSGQGSNLDLNADLLLNNASTAAMPTTTNSLR